MTTVVGVTDRLDVDQRFALEGVAKVALEGLSGRGSGEGGTGQETHDSLRGLHFCFKVLLISWADVGLNSKEMRGQ